MAISDIKIVIKHYFFYFSLSIINEFLKLSNKRPPSIVLPCGRLKELIPDNVSDQILLRPPFQISNVVAYDTASTVFEMYRFVTKISYPSTSAKTIIYCKKLKHLEGWELGSGILYTVSSLFFSSKLLSFFPTVSVTENLTDLRDKADCKKSRNF